MLRYHWSDWPQGKKF